MKKILALGLLLCVGLFAQKLTIQGSTTVLPIAQAAAEAYMDDHPEADITVRGGGSGTGIAALIDGATDIADASRPMKEKEITLAHERSIDPVANIVARDGIAVIVHPNNPMNNIMKEDLKAIYTGEITSWEKISSAQDAIVVVSRDAASGTFEAFNELALDKAKLSDAALMLASNLEVARTVAQTPGAIGYVGLGYLSDEVKAVKVNDIMPSESTVNDGTYPLARPLFMYTNGMPSGLAKDFLDFIMSADGQTIVKEAGFVPIK
ncbi:phosphate ABC transporter substrate-binding protein [candidate division WOR_3 bacterium SM23_60]|uniref:Phosphate-binding protein n=1 Tax=candidate division WOR_3 bacterium SM23_60 TaxID=1703780 RepID=A0A0S8GMQ6_UNCW3|nr:MAG: phosphate ABC transporter substrate-binding protein [candidate division WOR_3 bacterium SM23_60]